MLGIERLCGGSGRQLGRHAGAVVRRCRVRTVSAARLVVISPRRPSSRAEHRAFNRGCARQAILGRSADSMRGNYHEHGAWCRRWSRAGARVTVVGHITPALRTIAMAGVKFASAAPRQAEGWRF